MNKELEKAFKKMGTSHEVMAFVENHYKTKRDDDYLICINPDWEEEYELVENALKRNTSMKVTQTGTMQNISFFDCPNCDTRMYYESERADDHKYCMECGQKLDWGND